MPPQGRAERAVLVLFGELVPELVVELEAVKLLGQLELGGMMSVQTGAPIIPGARAPLHLHKKSAERKMERGSRLEGRVPLHPYRRITIWGRLGGERDSPLTVYRIYRSFDSIKL